MRRRGILAAGLLLICLPAAAGARPTRPLGSVELANRCVALAAGAEKVPGRFDLKPTGLATYLLHDDEGLLVTAAGARTATPGPAAEWTIRPASRHRFTIRSTQTQAWLTTEPGSKALTTAPRATRFRIARARGCRSYPEASLGATGRPFRGTRRRPVWGWADAHLHITANLRAGGSVLSGEPFDRFGITEALGRDADVHGSDGSLDVTGNLLRSGSPAGTHDTHGWPTFAGWPTFDTYTHQQVYYRWLQRSWLSGMRLVVAQTIEDEPLCRIEPLRSHDCDETATIGLEVAQLRALQDYVDAQSGGRGRGWFRLVTGPAQARRVIERGRLAVLIGAESSDLFGCSEFQGKPNCDRARIDAGIATMRRLGISSLFLAHWVDNALAGAALEGGDKGTFIAAMQVEQTGSPFQTGPCPDPAQGEEVLPVPVTGRQCNARGLTELGAYAVGRLMDAHLLIEVDHLSEIAREQVLELAEKRGYPLVSSHTGTGGLWTAAQLRRLYRLGGYATATVDDADRLAARILELGSYQGARPAGIGLGSDTGGFNALPAPDTRPGRQQLQYPFRSYDGRVTFACQVSGARTFNLNTDGVAHYGLIPDLLAQVSREPGGKRAMELLFGSAGAYLRTWRHTGAR